MIFDTIVSKRGLPLCYYMSAEKIRIDKWMWAVRLFKTRSMAADFCERGRVKINEQAVKASRSVKIGEVIIIHQGSFQKQLKVLQLTEKRMNAPLVKDFLEDITSPEEMEKFRLHKLAAASYNLQGKGRPTKKDRREMEDFFNLGEDW